MAKEVAILGVGMHPWGKWGKNFVEYGVKACRDALTDAGLDWKDVQFLAGADTMRNGYPGYVAGATFAQALGWSGTPVTSSYAACASGDDGTEPRAILAGMCDVALVVGADTTPKGFLTPNDGERGDDPDWLRFHLMGATNPTYFALYARRRMDLFGATTDDFAQVKIKNARNGLNNPNAATARKSPRPTCQVADGRRPLRLLDICATSDGGAAVVLCSMDYARKHLSGADPTVRVAAISTVTPTFPNTIIEMPNFATDSAAGRAGPDLQAGHCSGATSRLGSAGGHDVAEVYDLSTALELDWYEDLGFCKPGEAERLLRDGDTPIDGRLPVNPSGGSPASAKRFRPGHGPGVRARLAAPRPGRRPPGEGAKPASPPTRACSGTVRR